MSIQDLGSIGELIAAVATVATLAYLALQIRQNTSAVQASALDSSVGGVNGVRAKIFEDSTLTELYTRGLEDPEALTQVELTRFSLVMHNITWGLWNVYSQANFAELSTDLWMSQENVIRRVYSSEGGKWFLREFGREFPESFISEIGKAIEAGTEHDA